MLVRRAGKEKTGERGRAQHIVIRVAALSVLIAGLIFAGSAYVNNYYHATDTAVAALQGNGEVQVWERKNYLLFAPADNGGAAAGIIFYPGAKVEETAYAPLATRLAECGYPVYVMRMPARLAVLDQGAAGRVIAEESEVDRWILMGHSLGGAMAADYAADDGQDICALVLLAAYSTKDLKDSGIEVISIYGSEDGVLNRDKYEKYRGNLPESAYECVIDGGNHAGFGNYGSQRGDGETEISAAEQQQSVVDAVRYYLEEQ